MFHHSFIAIIIVNLSRYNECRESLVLMTNKCNEIANISTEDLQSKYISVISIMRNSFYQLSK